MLRAIGMTDDDWDKPQIAVASSWNEVTPCNMPLDALAKRSKEGVRDAGGYPIEFTTIAVSDGISMGHEGMRASLVSREIIADSVETMVHAERFDALVTFAGCDKSLPGMMMAAARLNLPSVFLYGGSILPGEHDGRALDIVSVFEAVGAHAAGAIDDAELDAIERNACPTIGSCAGMFTANTMAAIGEAHRPVPARLGVPAGGRPPPPRLRLRVRPRPWSASSSSASAPARSSPRRPSRTPSPSRWPSAAPPTRCSTSSPSRPRRGWTSPSRTSTGSRPACPHIADTKPHGAYHMADVDQVGGVPVVLRHLLEAGLLHGDCLTVTGKTMAENLAELDPPAPDGKVIHPLSDAIHPIGGIAVLRGTPGAERRGREGGGHRRAALRGAGPRVRRRGRRDGGGPGRPDRRRATSSSSATRAPRAVPACGRCWPSPAP